MKRKAVYFTSAVILTIQILISAGFPCHATEEQKPVITSIAVSPGTVVIPKNETCAFTVTISGSNFSGAVAWSVSGQTSQNTFIDANGILNVAADEGASSLTVKAVSKEDSTFSASALALIQPQDNNTQNNNNQSQNDNAQPKNDNVQPKTYTITASVSSAHGTITPEGKTTVTEGAGVFYTITPDNGYAVRTVYVDGKELGKTTSFNFTNVREDHTISADFMETPQQNNNSEKPANQPEIKDDPEQKPEEKDEKENTGKDEDDKKKQDEENAADGDEREKLTGTLAELNVSIEEAKRLIEENMDGELLAAARNTGDLQLTVRNDFMDTARDNYGVPYFERLPEQLLSGEERLAMLRGDLSVTIELSVNDTEGKTALRTKEAFEEKKLPGMEIGRYFEISLKEMKNKKTQSVSVLPEKLQVVITVPEPLQKENRQFYILRLHEEEDGSQAFAQLSDEDDTADTITFSTDQFSPYAIAYIDFEAGEADALAVEDNGGTTAVKAIVAVIVALAIGITSLGVWYIMNRRRS
ncbi:MAG: Ig-like domain-containing protein [Eubacterium sp.]|nr:Ig-like domain-containing protein [Eubacterium sp.]